MSERIFHETQPTTPCWADKPSILSPSGLFECGVYTDTELGLCDTHEDELVPDE